MSEKQKSFFQSHPTLRNAFRAAVAVAVVGAAVALFGPETVKTWITDTMAYFGVGGIP